MKCLFNSLLIVTIMAAMMQGCATTKAKKSYGGKKSAGASKKSAPSPKNDDTDVADVKRTLTYSMSDSPLTSKRLDRSEARDYSKDLSSSLKGDNVKEIEGFIIARTLSGGNWAEVLGASKRLMAVKLSKNVDSELSPAAKLQIALAAINSQKYGMALHFIDELKASKVPKIQAAALNLDGLLALREDRLPEASKLWKDAIRIGGGYQPAQLNLGFLALKYGDHKTAVSALSKFQNDWFALYGLLVAQRLAGKVNQVETLCKRVLSQKEDYKPAMLSCALNKFEGKKDYGGAKKLLSDLVKIKEGGTYIDEIAYRVMGKINKAMAQAKKPKVAKQQKKAAPPAQKTKAPKK